jgi:hypothetical protein
LRAEDGECDRGGPEKQLQRDGLEKSLDVASSGESF